MNMNDAFVGSLIFNKNGGGGGASAMSDLTDVAITSPSEGETLVYDSTSEKWVNGTGSAPALDDLTDVDVTTPSNGDTLVYDSANSKWVNGQGGGKQTALTQAQYDALVQAGTVDPTMEYFITDGIPSSVEYYHNYSTDEHIVGTWIDGRYIYEKSYAQPFTQGEVNLDIDITPLNMDVLLDFTCTLKSSPEEATQQAILVPYMTSNFVSVSYFSSDVGYIRVNRQQSHFYGTTPTVYMTIHYIKYST